MTYALAISILTFAALALAWCALSLHVGAIRPADPSPRWSDIGPFCGALWRAVVGWGELQPARGEVEKP